MRIAQKIKNLFKKETKKTVTHTKIPEIEFYKDYPNQPYISSNRDIDRWLTACQKEPKYIVPYENMVRDDIGLLPGDIYLLYFLFRHRNKKFPYYFEYFFGIDVHKELQFLEANGFIDQNAKPTQNGRKQIDDYAIYLEQMKHYLQQNFSNEIS